MMMRVGPARFAVPLAACAACFSDSIVDSQIPAGAVEIEFTVIEGAHGAFSGFTQRGAFVLRDEVELAAFWTELNLSVDPAPPLPTVDFTDNLVVAAAMGTKPSGGFDVAVASVHQFRNQLFVELVETSPGPRCNVTTVLTSPTTAVVVPAMGQVSFVRIEQVRDC